LHPVPREVAAGRVTEPFPHERREAAREEDGEAVCYLARHVMQLADIDGFITHPGGSKVLDALEEVFGLSSGGLIDSRAVLRDHGNMSAATVLFVLDRARKRGVRGRLLLSSLGPGFTGSFLTLDVA
ncbi:type III polyketide synthase, partial [bacterium]|nr:type III polyketide synthase [bacterium]